MNNQNEVTPGLKARSDSLLELLMPGSDAQKQMANEDLAVMFVKGKLHLLVNRLIEIGLKSEALKDFRYQEYINSTIQKLERTEQAHMALLQAKVRELAALETARKYQFSPLEAIEKARDNIKLKLKTFKKRISCC